MRRASRTIYAGILLAVTITAFAACDRLPVYSHYEHTPLSGWEKNDTISFSINPVKEAGYYREEVGLRINEDYPFQGLCLVVHQTILPSGYHHSDTLNCILIDKDGRMKGSGIKHYQYQFHINTIRLAEGDSLHIEVKHNMKREIMPGITDIGIRVDRQ